MSIYTLREIVHKKEETRICFSSAHCSLEVAR